MADSTGEALVGELEALFEPLANAAQNEQHLATFLDAVGQNVDDLSASERQQLSTAIGDAESAVETLSNMADTSDGDLKPLEVLRASVDAFVAVQSISDALSGVDVPDIGAALIDHLVLLYLDSEHPLLFRGAVLLTVVRLPNPHDGDLPGDVPADLLPYVMQEAGDFDPSVVGDLLSEPFQTLQEYYLPEGDLTPADADRVAAIVFPQLADLLGTFGFSVGYAFDSQRVQNYHGVQGLTRTSKVLSASWKTENSAFLVHVALAEYEGRLALVVSQEGSASVDVDADRWAFVFGATGDFDAFVVDRTGVVTASQAGGDSPSLGLSVDVSRRPPADTPDGKAVRIGSAGGTNLGIGSVGAGGSVELPAGSGPVEGNVSASASDARLSVAPGEGDSFLQKVLPSEGISVPFDAGIGWGTDRGLYFEGGGSGLKTQIPVSLDIGGVVQVETLRLAAQPNPSGDSLTIPVQLAADPQVSLGPFDAVVKGIGLEAEIAFPEDNSGNLGPLGVDLGFKPPTGAGMSLDAGVVTGGGFLTFDYEKERYTGVLQLKIGELTITAVGLLTTQLPNGRDGFSLLLIIAGEFPAFQLGFGFTLDGLGGLIGANRSIDVDYLTAGLSDGTVGSIMFPDDPVRNAPEIISDLRSGFPVAAGNHVVGPMAKLGWGTPSMLSASLGVLLDVPSPVRVVLLGRVHVGLPHEAVGIAVFNMDLLGAVDIEAQQANGAASLYDSRIVAYVITGDMAVKTGWGDDATFVLSVGGFNPRFEPPDGFPSLDRIALSIGPGNPEIRLAGYFAVTSNTVQVGARVEAYAAAAGFSFEGKIGFDTLFRFQPFELVADFYAGFSLKRGGTTLMGVDIDGTLKGPGPWSLRGKASFKIWPVSFSVSVDAEFGPSKSADALSPADVFGQVVAGLSDARNWTAQRPAGGESIVTVREVEREGNQVLAHPLGRIAVRQQTAPLAVRIEKFGNGKPAGYDRYEISGATVGETGETGETTRERFAPAEYFDLSEAEKLDGPEFERYEAGWRLDNTTFKFGGSGDAALLADGLLDYETAVIDEQASFLPVSVGRVAMPASTATALASVSPVARGNLRTTGEARFEVTDESTGPTGVEASLSVGDAQYVVVTASDMTRLDIDGVPADGTTKREAREALDRHLEESGGERGDYGVVATHEAVDGGQP